MKTVRNFIETSEVSCSEAQEELERLLQDPRFHGTERTRSILRYLAERRFEGQEDSVKAYAIAIDILGRGSDFDPAIDPIVRIEMSRLRSSLTQYYEAFGDATGVAISLPKGNYIAVFTRTGDGNGTIQGHLPITALRHEDAGTEHSHRPPSASIPEQAQGREWRLLDKLSLAVGVAAFAGAVWFLVQPRLTVRPSVAVTMSVVEGSMQSEASLTQDMLMTALTQFRTLTVASGRLAAGSLATTLRPPVSNAYAIDLKYYGDADDRSVWWQIVDVRSGDLLKSGLEKVSIEGKTAAAVRDELVSVLSRRFATIRGVINNIEARQSADGALGNACVLRAEYYLDERRPADLAGVAGCLEKTIAADPANSDAIAVLARVIAAGAGGMASAETIERSRDLAARAVSLAPLSDRAQIALMMAQFYSGRTIAAIDAGNRAMALNPNNPDAAAKLGMVLYSSGYWGAGVSLAQDAARAVDAVPCDARLVLALDAYRRKDWSEALLLVEQINSGDLIVSMLGVASLGELGSAQAPLGLAEVRSRNPDFERDYAKLMATRRYVPALATSIRAGLTKAGARIEAHSVASAL